MITVHSDGYLAHRFAAIAETASNVRSGFEWLTNASRAGAQQGEFAGTGHSNTTEPNGIKDRRQRHELRIGYLEHRFGNLRYLIQRRAQRPNSEGSKRQ